MKLAPILLAGLLVAVSGFSNAATPAGNTLEDFYTAALNFSPQLKIARERWNIGSARKDSGPIACPRQICPSPRRCSPRSIA